MSPPNSYVEILPSKDDGVRKWGLTHEEGAQAMSGIGALVIEAPGRCSSCHLEKAPAANQDGALRPTTLSPWS